MLCMFIYDREYFAIQQASREDFDWEGIFEGTKWFRPTEATSVLGEIKLKSIRMRIRLPELYVIIEFFRLGSLCHKLCL